MSLIIIFYELTHLRRHDVTVKWIAALAVHIHWFNPIVYFVRRELDRACELACDESVIKRLDTGGKQSYGDTLIDMAADTKKPKMIVSVTMCEEKKTLKDRLGAIMKYKGFSVFAAVVSCALIVIVLCGTVILGTSGYNIGATELWGAQYTVKRVIYDTGNTPEPRPEFCITTDFGLYLNYAGDDGWMFAGQMQPYALSLAELKKNCGYTAGWVSNYKVRKITDAYILKMPDNYFYIAMQTRTGDTLIGYGWEDIGERGQGASDDTCIYSLFLLESAFSENTAYSGYCERSLISLTGKTVNCFSSHHIDSSEYQVVGFVSGGETEMSDMGFAVFHFVDGRYRMLDYHVYANAAISGNGIYYAEHPAVADAKGRTRDDTSYEVFLSSNERLAYIVKVLDGGQEIRMTVDGRPYSMTLMSWADERQASEILLYFTDGSSQIPTNNNVPSEAVIP